MHENRHFGICTSGCLVFGRVIADGAGTGWDILNQDVVDLYQAGKCDRARPIAQKALAVAERTFDSDHPNVATSLNNLAELYGQRDDYVKMQPVLERSLAIQEKALGPKHPELATGLNNLGSTYYNQVDYAEAEPLYKRSLAIWESHIQLHTREMNEDPLTIRLGRR